MSDPQYCFIYKLNICFLTTEIQVVLLIERGHLVYFYIF